MNTHEMIELVLEGYDPSDVLDEALPKELKMKLWQHAYQAGAKRFWHSPSGKRIEPMIPGGTGAGDKARGSVLKLMQQAEYLKLLRRAQKGQTTLPPIMSPGLTKKVSQHAKLAREISKLR